MVGRYLNKGKMYVLDDSGVKCECVVTDEGDGILEIKNIATAPAFQRKGYARALIEFLVEKYRGRFSIIQVGTGDSPLTIRFYEKCGFVRSHIVPNFFVDNYDHPIYECGALLVIWYICKGLYKTNSSLSKKTLYIAKRCFYGCWAYSAARRPPVANIARRCCFSR